MARPPPDPSFCLRGSRTPVTCLKFRSEDFLYSGHMDGNIHVWCMKTKRVTSTIPAHLGHSVLWLDFISDNFMVTQGRNGIIKLWTMTDSNWVENGYIQTASLGFCKGHILDKDTIVIPGEDQSEVKVYDLVSGQFTTQLKADQDERKYGMCMSIRSARNVAGSSYIIVGYENGCVALWETRQNRMMDSLKVHDESVMCLAYSETLQKGYSGSANELLKSWTTDEGLKVKDTATIVNPGFNDVIVRDDNKIIVAAGWDSKVRVFGAKHLKPLAVLSCHKDSVNCLTFSDQKLLACGSKDNQISLWDIYR